MKKITIWANEVNDYWTLTIDDEDVTSGYRDDIISDLDWYIKDYEERHKID